MRSGQANVLCDACGPAAEAGSSYMAKLGAEYRRVNICT
jgi:hypothetical protein